MSDLVELANRLEQRAVWIDTTQGEGNQAFVGPTDAKLFRLGATRLREAADALERAQRERDDLRLSVIAFAGPHAARYAQEFGLAPGELHPTHYDILESAGARMDDFRRAALSNPLPKAQGEDE